MLGGGAELGDAVGDPEPAGVAVALVGEPDAAGVDEAHIADAAVVLLVGLAGHHVAASTPARASAQRSGVESRVRISSSLRGVAWQ